MLLSQKQSSMTYGFQLMENMFKNSSRFLDTVWIATVYLPVGKWGFRSPILVLLSIADGTPIVPQCFQSHIEKTSLFQSTLHLALNRMKLTTNTQRIKKAQILNQKMSGYEICTYCKCARFLYLEKGIALQPLILSNIISQWGEKCCFSHLMLSCEMWSFSSPLSKH